MAKTDEKPTNAEVSELFTKATSDPSSIQPIGQYIKTGRRWDVTHKDVLGDLLVLHKAKDIDTQYGPAVLVDVDHKGEQKTVLFGGKVLIDQVHDVGDKFPCLAVIRKPARAYALFSPSPEEIEAYVEEYVNK